VKPVGLPAGIDRLGKQAARRADGPAGKGRRKKRKPACNELDRGCAVGNITPPERGLTSKPGLSSRESWTNHLSGKADDGGLRSGWGAR
jgi:hypothetical protein